MLTADQLRALVMASLVGSRPGYVPGAYARKHAGDQGVLLGGVADDANLIIAFAESAHARGSRAGAPAFETDDHGDRGVVVVPPARAHRLDQPAAPAAS